MRGRKIVSGLFFAALAALLVWAGLTFFFKKYLNYPQEYFGIGNSAPASDASGEDVLFDDDATVDWSDPATDVFDPSTAPAPSSPESSQKEELSYEFALTSEYFDALLLKYSDGLPLQDLTSSFGDGIVVLTGNAVVSRMGELLDIPAALIIFMPETVPCSLQCVPEVSEGRLQVKVTKVSAGSDILAPYLSRSEILECVEGFLNEQITKYLPSNYKMQSARVSESGMYVRFSVQ